MTFNQSPYELLKLHGILNALADSAAEGGLSQLSFNTGLTVVGMGVAVGLLGLTGGEALDQWTAYTVDYELKRTGNILKGGEP